MKDACYCHRSGKRPCFSKFSGRKEDDLNSFVKVFWNLEKPDQDEFVTSLVSFQVDVSAVDTKGIGLVSLCLSSNFIHGFVVPLIQLT